MAVVLVRLVISNESGLFSSAVGSAPKISGGTCSCILSVGIVTTLQMWSLRDENTIHAVIQDIVLHNTRRCAFYIKSVSVSPAVEMEEAKTTFITSSAVFCCNSGLNAKEVCCKHDARRLVYKAAALPEFLHNYSTRTGAIDVREPCGARTRTVSAAWLPHLARKRHRRGSRRGLRPGRRRVVRSVSSIWSWARTQPTTAPEGRDKA
jgi:hypothetical protein